MSALRLRPGLAAVAGLGLASLALAGCGNSIGTLSVPEPPATTVAAPAPPDSLSPTLASQSETPVPGQTTTTAPALTPGPASINGTVLGPGGPVPGATVEADRFVGNSIVSGRATTGPDGSFSFQHVLGGRYRLRAWKSPSLDMAQPAIQFVVAGQAQALTLQLSAYGQQSVQVAINPAEPVQGSAANLVVQVTNPGVDSDGVLTENPVAGAAVTLVNGPNWEVTNGNPLNTDSNGQVLFQVICTAAGSDPLSAQVAGQPPVDLQMPTCQPPPTTTQPTSPPSTSGDSFPTTTCPSVANRSGGTTTTSTSLAYGC